MALSFEYQVCQVQNSRVTFVNGEWQGTGPLDAERDEESLNSCPKVWEYLQHAGTEDLTRSRQLPASTPRTKCRVSSNRSSAMKARSRSTSTMTRCS